MNTITIDAGLGQLTMTTAQVEKLYRDVQFLEDAALSLINPTAADKSDLPFTSEQYKKHLHEYFLQSGYCQDFVSDIFNS